MSVTESLHAVEGRRTKYSHISGQAGTLQCILYSLQCTLYTEHCTVYTEQQALFTVYFKQVTVQLAWRPLLPYPPTGLSKESIKHCLKVWGGGINLKSKCFSKHLGALLGNIQKGKGNCEGGMKVCVFWGTLLD